MRVFLAYGSTDLRKSIDGLAAIVQESFGLDPFSSGLFVFCNRAFNKLKILYWNYNGFWLYYRRLERGRFQWPTGGYFKQGAPLAAGWSFTQPTASSSQGQCRFRHLVTSL
ncbi:IS66 family insertion sequence element accessory protein TnpB [Paenibacillus sp. MMO-58]|uniref:IS66 family insertion sequence element accessory protein TnpB n=1 Tax=Paenibacillus sp. MMO-58 TaxID=3081290 RepID=UPI0030179B61